MIIGIDGNEANVEKRVGIGEYAFELLKQFKEYQILPISNVKYQIYLKKRPLGHMPRESENFRYIVFGPKKLWTQFALPVRLFISRDKPDVFFTPSHYSPRFSPVPTVVSVMDLSYIHFPELFNTKDLYQLENWTKYSVKKAKKVLTISIATQNDIIKEYGLSGDRVVVTYPGVKPISDFRPHIYTMQRLSELYGIKGEYILFVGTLQPRKNIERLIEAFAKIKRDNLQLVIVGKKGWLFEPILAAPKRLGISERVKFLDFVSDQELPELYKHALCFVLPSLYEGFGLPVLEAMKYGCPVITSNVSSLPEAGGDAAVYVDPTDVDDIAKKIEKVLADEKLREEMIRKGKKHFEKFSWEKTARETLRVLEEVVGEK